MSIDELQPTKRARAGKGAQVKADAKFLRGSKFAKASTPGKAVHVKKQSAVAATVSWFEETVRAWRAANAHYHKMRAECAPGAMRLRRALKELNECKAKCDRALLHAQAALATKTLKSLNQATRKDKK